MIIIVVVFVNIVTVSRMPHHIEPFSGLGNMVVSLSAVDSARVQYNLCYSFDSNVCIGCVKRWCAVKLRFPLLKKKINEPCLIEITFPASLKHKQLIVNAMLLEFDMYH